MALKDCVGRLVNLQKITPAMGDELQSEVDKIIAARGLDGNIPTVRKEVEMDVLTSFVSDAQTRVRGAALEIKRFNEKLTKMKADKFSMDNGFAEDLDVVYEGASPLFASMMGPVHKSLVRLRSKVGGKFGGKYGLTGERGRAFEDEIGRALDGATDVSSEALDAAKAYREVDARAVQLQKSVGIDVTPRKDLKPSDWSPQRIRENFSDAESFAKKIVDEEGYQSFHPVSGALNPVGLTRAIAKDSYNTFTTGSKSTEHQNKWFKQNPDFDDMSFKEADPAADMEDLAKKQEKQTFQELTKKDVQDIVDDKLSEADRATVKQGNKLLGSKLNDRLLSKTRRSRVLHAPNYEAWKRVNEVAGEGSLTDQLNSFYAQKAHEINLAANYGPNYQRVLKELNRRASVERANRPTKDSPNQGTKIDQEIFAAEGLRKIPKKLQKVFLDKNGTLLSNASRIKVLTKQSEQIGNPTFADWAAGLRNIVGAGLMSGSSIVALTDRAYLARLSRMLGTDYKKIERDLFRMMRDTATSEKEFEKLVIHYGAGIEYIAQAGGSGSRFTDTGVVGGVSQVGDRLMDFTLGTNGLNTMTRVAEHAAKIDVDRGIANAIDNARSSKSKNGGDLFSNLSEQYQNIFKEFSIGANELEEIASSIERVEVPGKSYTYDLINSNKINNTQALVRYMSMQGRLVREAVPRPGLEARAVVTHGGAKRGTVSGEIARTFWQLQSFPITVLFDTIRLYGRSDRFVANKLGKLNDVARLTAQALFLGLIAIQAREISKGRTPMSVDNTSLWLNAAILSSPLGFGTDSIGKLHNDSNRAAKSLLGPTPGVMLKGFDILSDTYKNGIASGAELGLKEAGKVTPLPFYLKQLYQDRVIGSFREMLDPESYKRRQRSTEQYHEKIRENSFYGNGNK